MKKLPKFGDLDLSKLVSSNVVDKKETESDQQTDTSTTVDKSPTKIIEGAWVSGKSVEDITSEEFKEWLITIIPGTGVEDWDNKLVATERDRSKVIGALANRYENLFKFPKNSIENKQYLQ